MIIVTGASNQLGRQVIEQLLERIAPDRIGASVREPEKAADLAERGIRVRHGDFADAASLADSFAGATKVLVVSANAPGDAAKTLNATALRAAATAGAEHVYYTSHVGVSDVSAFPPMTVHDATEAVGRDLDVPFTALRNGFYAEFAPNLLGDAVVTGALEAPADGPMSWTTHADIAEAIAIILGDGIGDDVIALTASRAVDLADIAAVASALTGREIRRVVVDEDSYRARLAARGLPEGAISASMGIFAAARHGQFSTVDPTLERLIGRPPISIESVLRNALSTEGLAPTRR
ncbi:NAD(P)H-binding protein [soil metagenome]